MFAEEVELVGRLTGTTLLAEPGDFVFWRSGRDYYALGRKVFRVVGGAWEELPTVVICDSELFARLSGSRKGRKPAFSRRSPKETVAVLAEANAVHLARLEEEAVSFLRAVREQYRGLPFVVSWSGGKDSTVVSYLTRKAFPGERITHVFADTTIELPSTYEYLGVFRAANPTVPFLIGVPVRDFFQLCEEIGPPSRIQRWCCTTHKAAPLAEVYHAIGDGRPVVAVVGLRRSESLRRRSYDRVMEDSKIGRQILISPIADWSDFDVWTWTLVQRLPLHKGYRSGMDRVGCAVCPDASDWWQTIAAAAEPGYFRRWRRQLVAFFRRAGVQRPEHYVAHGAWRNRRGGAVGRMGLPGAHTYGVSTQPCEVDERGVSYRLSSGFSVHRLRELLKIFGRVDLRFWREEFAHGTVSGPHGTFTVEAFADDREIRVVFDAERTKRRLAGTLRAQLRKLQACVACGGCAAICPQGAITGVGEYWQIEESRCHHCLSCVRKIKAGCWAADSLHARRPPICRVLA